MNAEQKLAFAAVESGRNLFITGPAGTGKSYVIQQIRQWAKRHSKNIALTAMTGCAAVLIGGRTLHSTLSLGLGTGTAEDIAAALERNRIQLRRVKAMHILVIDEVSMMNSELFDKVSYVLSLARRDHRPFGGVQMVLCGDFCQLGPVTGDYCFKSAMWQHVHSVTLHQLMRQEDTDFQNMLNSLRMGRLDKPIYKVLKGCINREFDGEIQPTVLYSLRRHVDAVNKNEYDALVAAGANERVYSTTYGDQYRAQVIKWAENIGVPSEVKLCIGAQVVITANLDVDAGIVNGTRGIVVGLPSAGPELELINRSRYVVEMKKLSDDNDILTLKYHPVQFAWALTINKSQGMTLDRAAIDLGSSIFAPGQAYTALSRVKNLEGVCILGLSKQAFITHPDVVEFYGVNQSVPALAPVLRETSAPLSVA